MSKLLSLFKSKNTILADGACGTLLYQKGVFINKNFEEVNITNPKLIKSIHKEYKNAGSDFITTNTFQANSFSLKSYGLSEKMREIIINGAELAREIADNDILVAGSIGPIGVSTIKPYGVISKNDAKHTFEYQARMLEKGKVDFFILETFQYLHELIFAIDTISNISSLPIVAQLSLNNNGTTYVGKHTDRFTNALNNTCAIAIGISCSSGPQQVLEITSDMKRYTDKYIIAQPNAGLPKHVDGRNIYLSTPEYFRKYASNFIKTGIKIIGGCCGTTPLHIKEMSLAIKATSGDDINTKTKTQNIKSIQIKDNLASSVNTIKPKDKSSLASKIISKQFICTVEITPPRGCDAGNVIKKAKLLKEKGVDAINIPDGPRASSRMSAMLLSILIEQQAQIETIMHYTCRDRNILGIQSDLLGAYASGLHNILIITGDPPKMGDYPNATAVFDLNSVGLVKIVDGFNKAYDIGGNTFTKPTGYFIGVGVNPTAYDLNYELDKFQKKVSAGAEFAITQPVFDTNVFFHFMEEIDKRNIKIPIIAGIWPLVSFRNAEFMENEVPGVSVSKNILDRMQKASDISKERGLEEGLAICSETISQIKSNVSGIQVSAPFGKVEYATKAMKDILISKT